MSFVLKNRKSGPWDPRYRYGSWPGSFSSVWSSPYSLADTWPPRPSERMIAVRSRSTIMWCIAGPGIVASRSRVRPTLSDQCSLSKGRHRSTAALRRGVRAVIGRPDARRSGDALRAGTTQRLRGPNQVERLA
jgi:hypothetical protein